MNPSIRIKCSLILNAYSDWYKGVAFWGELVEKRSKGRIGVDIYPEAELAEYDQQRELKMLQEGQLEASVESTILLSGLDRRLLVFSLPWLFENYRDVEKVCRSRWASGLLEGLPESGVVGLAYGANGFRQLTNSRKQVAGPRDLNGLKIRVPHNEMMERMFRLFGAEPAVMNFGELFVALQSGTVDGQENPLAVIDAARLYKVQGYLSSWNYSYDPVVLCFNSDAWDALSREDRKILKEAAEVAMRYQSRLVESGEAGLSGKLEELGVEIHQPAPEKLSSFKEVSRPIYRDVAPLIGKDVIDGLQDLLPRAAQLFEAR